MSKAINILKLTQLLNGSRMTCPEIAQELGCSERTVYRYMQALSGVLDAPVVCEGGYKLAKGWRLSPISLTDEEATALRLAVSASPLRKTEPFNHHLGSLLRKLQGTLTESSAETVQEAGKVVAFGIPLQGSTHLPAGLLATVESAALHHHRLLLRYCSPQAKQADDRRFDPYALVFRRHNWYLVGYCHKRRKQIQLKMSRIRSAMDLGTEFQLPEDFSVDRFYANSWELETGAPVDVEIIFDQEAAPYITETQRHPSQETEELPDGRVRFTVRVAGYREIGQWALTYGGHAEVLSPPELRDWMTQHVRRMAALYLDGSQPKG